ncbi:MAG: class I SAM-dependent methyltransferase [Opitutaceae bacterium]|nr:class I SAM-dependent methyltransferase [Opitutaceae bacterium]
MTSPSDPPSFDAYARDYDAALDQGLSLTGESRDFYARRRVEIVRDMCRHLGLRIGTVCDYGCGTGDTLPLLHELLATERLIGLDPSTASLAEARRRHVLFPIEWYTPDALDAAAAHSVDAVYCNGVFHHIAPAERLIAAQQIVRLLRPGGHWFFWENNPLNPGTRWVMSRIPFDRDAITLRPGEARRLGEEAGANWIETTFHFYFPNALRAFRRVEIWLRRLPLGGQYLVVLRKPFEAQRLGTGSAPRD